MEYGACETSGTDEDFSLYQNRDPIGGRFTVNGRYSVGPDPYINMHMDMEAQIHQLEREAYCSVLRAFKAQSDAITWEKEGLITELRKELRVSDDEHRELLTKVNADDIIKRIRDWRQTGGHQAARLGASQPVHDILPSPTFSGSRKKLKTSQSGPALHGLSMMSSMQYPSAGPARNRPFMNRNSSGAFSTNEPTEAAMQDPFIGRKVWTRWPEDNNFYEAVITEYNPAEGRHALVYDINTANETWEWVDLKEIPREDIRWEGEEPASSYRGGHGGRGHGTRNPFGRSSYAPGAGKGRGLSRSQGPGRRDAVPAQNRVERTVSDDIELLNTESLVKEVEKIFEANHPDLLELQKAKKMLKEHEQALVDAISRIAEVDDGESDGGRQISHGQLRDND